MTRVVVYEDRSTHWTGVQLTLLSLRRHSPELDVVAYLPRIVDAQRQWVDAHVPGIDVRVEPLDTLGGWNVKPSLLLAELVAGADEVFWIDSDVLVARPLRPLLNQHPADALIVAADNTAAPLRKTDDRTRAWGLPVGRPLPASVNSGFLRVLPAHVGLLSEWQAMLSTSAYQLDQQRPFRNRPLHHWGDQEVLTALLGSSRAQEIVISQLRAGIEMAQSQGPRGWTATERIRASVQGGPTMVHSMGPKPWLVPPISLRGTDGRGLRWWLTDLQIRCSPYTRLAWSYREALGEHGAWLDDHQSARDFNTARTCGLPGVPLAIATSPAALKRPMNDHRVSRQLAPYVEQHRNALALRENHESTEQDDPR
jgi:hypothetical protein